MKRLLACIRHVRFAPLRRGPLSPISALPILALVLAFATHSFPQSATTRAPQWRKDLRTLALNLVVLHKNVFFKISPRQFFDAVMGLDRDMDSLSDTEIMTRMGEIVAMVGDAHTGIYLNDPRLNFHRYPIQVKWFSDGLFVVGATPGYANTLACRIIRIGDSDVNAALLAVGRIISHENSWWLVKRSEDYLVIPEILHSLDLVAGTESAVFTFQDGSGDSFQMELQALAPRAVVDWIVAPDPAAVPQPLHLMRPTLNYWYEYLAENRAMYIRYRVCQSAVDNPIERFTDELIASMEQHPVDKVILDLRGNGGGNSGVIETVFDGVRSFFERHNLRPRDGIAIIDWGTFSSGVMAAVDVRAGGGILVGEPTGGKPNSYGNTKSFMLPASGLLVFYSTKYFYQVQGDPAALMPDIAVDAVSSDYFAGRDPFLEAALGGALPGPAVRMMMCAGHRDFIGDDPLAVVCARATSHFIHP